MENLAYFVLLFFNLDGKKNLTSKPEQNSYHSLNSLNHDIGGKAGNRRACVEQS